MRVILLDTRDLEFEYVDYYMILYIAGCCFTKMYSFFILVSTLIFSYIYGFGIISMHL